MKNWLVRHILNIYRNAAFPRIKMTYSQKIKFQLSIKMTTKMRVHVYIFYYFLLYSAIQRQ